MKGSVYHSIDFLTRVSQTLLSLLKAGPLGELVEGGRVTLELILTLLLNSLITFFVFYTISDFVGAKR